MAGHHQRPTYSATKCGNPIATLQEWLATYQLAHKKSTRRLIVAVSVRPELALNE